MKAPFLFSLMTERVLSIVQFWHTALKFYLVYSIEILFGIQH